MDILRTETLDQDLLLILFDRVPGNGEFQNGITLSPPGHQLSFEFGNGAWTPSSGQPQSVSQEWREVLITNYNAVTAINEEARSSSYPRNDNQPRGFDFENCALLTKDLANDALAATKIGSPSDPVSALLGTQLISGFPKLTIEDAPQSPPNDPTDVNLQRIGWNSVVQSEQLPANAASNALDGDNSTFWHSQYQGTNIPSNHDYKIDMRAVYQTSGLNYLPRQDGSPNGTITIALISTRYASNPDRQTRLIALASMVLSGIHL